MEVASSSIEISKVTSVLLFHIRNHITNLTIATRILRNNEKILLLIPLQREQEMIDSKPVATYDR